MRHAFLVLWVVPNPHIPCISAVLPFFPFPPLLRGLFLTQKQLRTIRGLHPPTELSSYTIVFLSNGFPPHFLFASPCSFSSPLYPFSPLLKSAPIFLFLGFGIRFLISPASFFFFTNIYNSSLLLSPNTDGFKDRTVFPPTLLFFLFWY